MTQNNLDFGAYTDFGELCAVIVGSAEGLTLPPFNPTLHHYNDEVQAALKASGDQPLDIRKAMPERWRKTVEQLDHLAALYEKNGIQVYRPRPASKRKAKPIRFSPSGAASSLCPGRHRLRAVLFFWNNSSQFYILFT